MKTETQTYTDPIIKIGNDIIPLSRDPEHEFTLPTVEVARGFGITEQAVRMQLKRRSDEFTEGKHFTSVTNCDAGLQRVQTHWTKRGIIRLGFFIRSKRAKAFRDAAEDLILKSPDTNPHPQLHALTSEVLYLRQALEKLGNDVSGIHDVFKTPEMTLPGQRIKKQPPSEDDFHKWLSNFSRKIARTGKSQATYTASELIKHHPPLPNGITSPVRSLGRKMAANARKPIRLPGGQVAHWFPYRTGNTRQWEIEIQSFS
jgi:hypothetical protein